MYDRPEQWTVNGMSTTRAVIYIGDEGSVWHGITERAGGRRLEVVDGKDTARVLEVLGPSLFATEKTVLIENAGQVSAEIYSEIPEGTTCYGSIVGNVKPSKQVKNLERVVDLVVCDQKWAEREVLLSFKRRGVEPDARAKRLLVEVCVADLGRARSVAEIARMAGIANLSESAARKLLGSQRRDVMIWEVCDNLFAGNLGKAVEASRGIEDVPLAANLAENLRVVLAASECSGADDLVRLLKIHPYVAKKRIETARKLGLENLQRGLAEACSAERMIRRREITAAVALVSVHLALRGQKHV